ncbi:MAG: hypothetical protein CME71_04005 [Halobacteriovorax sp.]|nr:hypothetical protein [Halobacteriovorax sp.]
MKLINGKLIITALAFLLGQTVFAQTAIPTLIPDPSIGLINVYGQVNSPFANFQAVSNGFDQVTRDPAYRRPSRSRTVSSRVVTSVTRNVVQTLPLLSSVGAAPGNGQCQIGEVPEVVEISEQPQQQDDQFPPLNRGFRAQGADCSRYITSDGSYGSLGQVIVDDIRSRGTDSIYYSNDIAGQRYVCPNWSNLSNREKEHFWVWSITALVHDESTCRTGRISVRGTNGTAVGPLQMELEPALRRSRYSAEFPHPNCVGPSRSGPYPEIVSSHENNLRCGLDILEKQLTIDRPLYRAERSRGLYWQSLLRPRGGEVGALIAQYPNCVAE